MSERVRPVDIGIVWEPNAPGAVLAADDTSQTALAVGPRRDDSDQRTIVLVWTGTRYSLMGDPNDEALPGHRLRGKGLEDVLWIGQVDASELIAALARQNEVHPQHSRDQFSELVHHVVLTKEKVVEVVARGLVALRVDASPTEAALRALAPRDRTQDRG